MERIEHAPTDMVVSDIVRQYCPSGKKVTKAEKAKKIGLDTVCDGLEEMVRRRKEDGGGQILDGAATQRLCQVFQSQSELTAEQVMAGTRDILVDRIAHDADVCALVREAMERSYLAVKEIKEKVKKESQSEKGGTWSLDKGAADAAPKYPRHSFTHYFDYVCSIRSVPSHSVLAINRGESAGYLRVSLNLGRDEKEHKEVLNALVMSVYHKRGYLHSHRLYRDYLPSTISSSHPSRCCVPLTNNPKAHPESSAHKPVIECEAAIMRAVNEYIMPKVVREVRGKLKKEAEESSLKTFRENLRGLLLTPRLPRNVSVLAIDPGIASGHKYAVIDGEGIVCEFGTLGKYRGGVAGGGAGGSRVGRTGRGGNEDSDDVDMKKIAAALSKWRVEVLAVGNGKGTERAQKMAKKAALCCNKQREENEKRRVEEEGNSLGKRKRKGEEEEAPVAPVCFILVNEAGASVYSASKLAREELPQMDVSIRGAVTLARRLQDHMAELVKVDPKSLGIGMYQHDVPAIRLQSALVLTIQSVVSEIGADVNTASAELLQYISGTLHPYLSTSSCLARYCHLSLTDRLTSLVPSLTSPLSVQHTSSIVIDTSPSIILISLSQSTY